MKRRAFLARCIQGVAGGVVLCQGARARPSARDLGARDDLDATLRWVLDTPRDRVLREASRRLLDGLPQATLRDATLLAAVAAIKPPPVGFCDHAVMAAYSHRQVVAELAAQFDQSAELADSRRCNRELRLFPTCDSRMCEPRRYLRMTTCANSGSASSTSSRRDGRARSTRG
jgi:hypothetical protein